MSGTFACVAPFPAIATIASRSLPRREALVMSVCAVAANQMVGFFFLKYPWTLATAVWAPVFLVATLGAYAAAVVIPQWPLALVAAFASYEIVLAAYSLAVTHSLAAFTPTIVSEVAVINIVSGAVVVLLSLVLSTVSRRGYSEA